LNDRHPITYIPDCQAVLIDILMGFAIGRKNQSETPADSAPKLKNPCGKSEEHQSEADDAIEAGSLLGCSGLPIKRW
jgi:hypothetical protein